MDEFTVKFEDCEYDAKTDTMTTTGKASYNGKEYDVSFTEIDGSAPVIKLVSDHVQMSYDDGETINGYGLGTEEGQALCHAVDTIYRTMFEKADDYQRNDPDAICARISYENKDVEEADIEIMEISRNTGDIGQLAGVVRINEDTLRFCADRDGSIYCLMPTGTAMQDVRTVPLADEVKCAICDAIHDGIVDYLEREENPTKDMAFPPVRADEIKGMSVDEVIEYLDWDISEDKDGDITIEAHSPAGEDLVIETTRDNLVQDIRDTAENFDVDEHVEMWVDMRGQKGVPESVRTLVEDAEAIQQKYYQLKGAVEIADREQSQERKNDDYER